MEEDRKEAARLRAEVAQLQKELSDKQQRLTEQRDAYLRKAREEARTILQEAKTQADKAIRNLNKQGVHVTGEIEAERTGLRELLDENERLLSPGQRKKIGSGREEEWKLGDRVRVISLNLEGTICALPNAKGEVTVQMGILRSTVSKDDLERLVDPEEKKSRQKGQPAAMHVSRSSHVRMELNLIGMTVDEAMPALDKYLDEAYLAHLPSVRIIHGRGTGALRSAVQGFLRRDKTRVANYRGGEYDEGGTGVTIVTFK